MSASNDPTFFGVRKEVFVLSFANFFSDFGAGMTIALVPLYIQFLKGGIFESLPLELRAGLAVSAFGITMALLQPFVGKWSDRTGKRKPFLLAGFLLFAITSLLYAYTTSFSQMMVLRMVHGMSVGIFIPATMAIIAHHSTRETRGRTMGMYSTLRGAGFGLGPVVGGAIATYYSFETAFYVAAILGVISFVMVKLLVAEVGGEVSKNMHPTAGDEQHKSAMRSIIMLASAMFVMMMGVMMIVALLPVYKTRLNASEFMLGLTISAFMLSRLVFQIPIGILADKIGKKRIIVVAMLASIPLVIMMAYVTTINQLIAIRLVQGITTAAIDTPAMALVADLAGGHNVASKMSYITTAFAGGITIGPLMGGALSGYVSFESPFYATGILMLLAALLISRNVHEVGHESR